MSRKWTVIALLALAAMTLCTVAALAQAPAHKIIGADKCKMCHQTEAKGNQYKVWLASAHAKAFADLALPAALEVGKKLGVAEPQKDPKCLGCHTTKGILGAAVDVTYKPEEGVGCEACHGAGSDYKAMPVMKVLDQAKAAGLVVPTEAVCVKCHNDKSPTFKAFKFAEAVKVIAHPNPAKVKG